MPLALGLGAEARDGLARRVNADLAAIEHLDAEDVEVLRRPRADDLREARDADTHELAAFPLLRLLAPEVGIADPVHGQAQGARIVPAVVLPAEGRLVRELLGLDEVLHPEFGRIHAQLVRHDVGHALDRVHRLRHAKRAAVGDAARRLVRVDPPPTRAPLSVVRPVQTWKSPRGLRGIGRRVGVAVIGDGLDPDRGERAVLLRRQPAEMW